MPVNAAVRHPASAFREIDTRHASAVQPRTGAYSADLAPPTMPGIPFHNENVRQKDCTHSREPVLSGLLAICGIRQSLFGLL